MYRTETDGENYNKLLGLIGTILIVGGLMFLFILGNLVYQIFADPSQSKAFLFIQQNLTSTDQLFSGTIDGKEFEISMNDAARNFGFILMAIFGLSIVFNIFNSLILTGASLIKSARKIAPKEPTPVKIKPSTY
jgi:hypothetical protein